MKLYAVATKKDEEHKGQERHHLTLAAVVKRLKEEWGFYNIETFETLEEAKAEWENRKIKMA